MPVTDALLTTIEAGRILKTVPNNVRRLAREGQLPVAAVVGDGQRLFSREAVCAFARAREDRRRRVAALAPNPAIQIEAEAIVAAPGGTAAERTAERALLTTSRIEIWRDALGISRAVEEIEGAPNSEEQDA